MRQGALKALGVMLLAAVMYWWDQGPLIAAELAGGAAPAVLRVGAGS